MYLHITSHTCKVICMQILHLLLKWLQSPLSLDLNVWCVFSFVPFGCFPCPVFFPEAGSGSCKPRPPCAESDYFYTHSPCDSEGQVMWKKSAVWRQSSCTAADFIVWILLATAIWLLLGFLKYKWCGLIVYVTESVVAFVVYSCLVCCMSQTQLMYKWIEPKICNETIEGAVNLPASGKKKTCPPCNPGFFVSNSSNCEPCTNGFYSNGTGADLVLFFTTYQALHILVRWLSFETRID